MLTEHGDAVIVGQKEVGVQQKFIGGKLSQTGSIFRRFKIRKFC